MCPLLAVLCNHNTNSIWLALNYLLKNIFCKLQHSRKLGFHSVIMGRVAICVMSSCVQDWFCVPWLLKLISFPIPSHIKILIIRQPFLCTNHQCFFSYIMSQAIHRGSLIYNSLQLYTNLMQYFYYLVHTTIPASGYRHMWAQEWVHVKPLLFIDEKWKKGKYISISTQETRFPCTVLTHF